MYVYKKGRRNYCDLIINISMMYCTHGNQLNFTPISIFILLIRKCPYSDNALRNVQKD